MKNFNDYYNSYCMKKILSEFAYKSDSVLLDLGCGKQPFKSFYINKFGRIIEADYERRCDLVDVIMDAQNLPLQSKSIDVIIFSEVIEHIPDHIKAISEISRVLKDGGYLILSWPFIYPMHEIPNDYFRLTEFGMQGLCNKNNLNLMCIYRRGGIFSLFFYLFFQIFFLGVTSLNKIHVIGLLSDFINKLFLYPLIEMANYIIFMSSKSFSKPVSNYGEGFKGSGHFNLWTLGYVAKLKKVKCED